MENLQTSYLGLKLRNPLIAASCGLTNSIPKIKELVSKGIGAVVIKSLFEEQISIETDIAIKTDNGEIKTLTKAPDRLFGKRIYDYDEAYSYLFDYAKANTLEKYLNFLREVKNSVDIPVAVKIGYYFSSMVQSVRKLSESGIKGLVLFNRPYNTDYNIDKIGLSHGPIFSSKEEYSRTLRWISILSGHVECDLSASTGVHDHEAFIKMLLAGATTVQIASVLYKEGLDVIPEILMNTIDWMRNQ